MQYRSFRSLRDVLLTSTALVAALTAAERASAGPLGTPQVQAGQVTVTSPAANKTVINQATSKAILNWNAFSIPSGSSVQFVQPSAGSIVLNRVTGGTVTNIAGQLTANGQVWIVNPNGVFFGPGAQVNVAGLIATTADIRNQDFLSGNYKFGIGSSNPNASIVNQGT
ncbi:MAG TPA: filamentous hemagglutinin N-terminal domain-containing protein, partial [Stellaceae bacterium]|nr:filamentous hemagglutinin N-terminal domain-containing protein [Stellaceae bacterium]